MIKLCANLVKKIYFRLKFSSACINSNEVSRNCSFGKFAAVEDYSTILNSNIGDYTYVREGAYIENADIGKFSCIAPHVVIGAYNHDYKYVAVHPFFRNVAWQKKYKFENFNNVNTRIQRTVIGSDVWIGVGVVIIGGVKIGEGAIIGAGAVVTKDVEAYSIVTGIPAKKNKDRFDEATIKSLKAIKWWDWDINKIQISLKDFEDVHKFIEKNNRKLQVQVEHFGKVEQ